MILFILVVSFITYLVINQWSGVRSNPKGPTPLPLLGNLPQLIFYAFKSNGVISMMNEFRKQYGPVFTIWMGPLPVVFISDYDLAHETHIKNKHVFGERSAMGVMNFNREGKGLLASNGDFWQEHRRFALQTLRNFGMGRNVMEGKIMDEFKYRFAEKMNKKGIEVHANSFFDLLVGSIINQMLVSERFEEDDKSFENLKNAIAASFERVTFIDVTLPLWLWKSKIMNWRSKVVLAPFTMILEITKETIAKKVASMKSHEIEEGNDFVEAFLVKMEQDKKNGLETTFNLETLALDVYDLWIGGQETTSTTLTWACAILLNYPEVVEKLFEELNELTESARLISLNDRPNTPYLNATVNEIQRYASILNVNLFRIMREDSVIDAQPIAAGTILTTQMGMIHTDEDLFKDHEEFRPERFLENNNLEKKLIPFGIGKRACPGESLARAELYLIISNMILNYHLEPVEKIPELKSPSPFAIMQRAPNFKIRFVPRG